jgi:DNA topoisomerase-2
MEVAASYAEDDGFSAIGLVNAIRCSQGTHIDQVARQLGDGILDLLPGKSLTRRSANLNAGSVKKYLRLVVKVLVDNPNFDSQTKTRLSTIKAKMGFDFELPQVFVKEVGDLGVFDAVLGDTRKKENKAVQTAMNKDSDRAPLHPKLEDARFAGKSGKNCTLIITEGDSAKALAVAGLGKWGREDYGIFPLKGKLMNVRSATSKMLRNNEEIKYLTQIIGLQWGRKYKSDDELRSSLRYQHVMIFADQDLDGDHIAGLLLNYVSAGWPSLLEIRPNFFLRFATPIVKVFDKKTKAGTGEKEMFLTEGDFVRWQEQNPDWGKKYRAKYYKGLGTSNRDEAIKYFSNPDEHVISFVREGLQDDRSVALAFAPGQEDDRKKWIEDGFEAPELDYTRSSATFSEFINWQLVKFSAYNCERALPLLLDGLKPSQRKVIYVARRVKGGEMRVSQMAGRVIEEAAYHHGEASLEGAIVHLAQNFIGSNNVNLLEPSGMFGSRLAGRDEHAASRYLHTQTSNLAKYIFRQEDDGILDKNVVDGKQVEPVFFLPVVPIVLLNGFKGIGTGWACNGPNYGPLEVADALKKRINGEPVPRLLPAYRGFRGRIVEQSNSDGSLRVYSEGVWKVHATVGNRVDTIEIKELPIGVWTDDFVEKVQLKAEQTGVMAEVYKCADHDDQNVHLLICVSPDEMAAGRYGHVTKSTNVTQLLGNFFNLRRSLSSTNYLFHRRVSGQEKETRVQHFADANAILEEFYEVRRGFYAKRKEHQIAVLSREVERKSNQVRFIRTFDHAKLRTAGAGAETLLEEAGFPRLSAEPATESSEEDGDDSKDSKASFGYLLRAGLGSNSSRPRIVRIEVSFAITHHNSDIHAWMAS